MDTGGRTTVRAAVLAQVAALVPPSQLDCVRIGIDGRDGAGKTRFADELAVVLHNHGRPTLRISVDDFHQPRAVRYRRGRSSPEGFFLDSFDYTGLWRDVLGPLGPDGSRVYRHAAHDRRTDEELRPEPRRAPAGTVVVIDGLFLHRAELRGAWELTVLLEVSAEVGVARLAARDGSPDDPAHPSLRRYLDAHRRYLAECAPHERADVLIDNTDLGAPRVLRTPMSHRPGSLRSRG